MGLWISSYFDDVVRRMFCFTALQVSISKTKQEIQKQGTITITGIRVYFDLPLWLHVVCVCAHAGMWIFVYWVSDYVIGNMIVHRS